MASLCFVRNPLSVFAFLGNGFLSVVITSMFLTLSTLVFKFSKQKPNLEQKDEVLIHPEGEKSPCFRTEDVEMVSEAELIHEGNEAVLETEEEVKESESVGRSSSSEDSEVLEWMRQDCSDGSISDEESLIEIELPGGQFVGNKNEKENSKKMFEEFESVGYSFLERQYGLLEVLREKSDMNEEENLIEIDISMGSIMCPRFEIEA